MFCNCDNYHMWDIILNENRYTPKPGDRVLDLGAWKGHFTMYCASRGAFVTAYEPVPDHYNAMMDRVKKEEWAGNITAVMAAVGNTNSRGVIYVPEDNDRSASEFRNGQPNDCAVANISNVIESERWDCVKVDIEGAEKYFIGIDLSHVKYLTMELHNDVLSKEEHDGLIETLEKNFRIVEKVEQYANGQPLGKICKVFCTR